MQLFSRLTTGRGKLFAITLVEGATLSQILTKLRQHPHIRQTLPEQQAGQRLAVLLGVAHAEGWLFPDTYHFEAGTTDVQLVKMAHKRMKKTLERLWKENENAQLASAYEALILASIIEKETAVAEERPLVSSVFTNRLARGMKLQTDPTVIYGLGEQFDGDIKFRDLRLDTPYNTYLHKGLPPTPIAMPGEAALYAAMHPAKTDYLYFVATGDGRHLFSRDYDSHRRAVNKYQKKQ